MNLKIVAMAAILILAGLVCASASNTIVKPQYPTQPNWQDVERIENITYYWNADVYYYNFSVALKKDDFVYLDVLAPTAWGEFAIGDPIPDYPDIYGYNGPIYVWVHFNYTMDNGEEKTTSFEIMYYYNIATFKMVTAPYFPIHVFPNVSETLFVENPNDCKLLGGVANFTGIYNIWMITMFQMDATKFEQFRNDNPDLKIPVELELYKFKEPYEELIKEQQPYKLLLPIGISFLGFGVVTLIWEKRNEKNRHFLKTKKVQ
jgi:hypothetical protein